MIRDLMFRTTLRDRTAPVQPALVQPVLLKCKVGYPTEANSQVCRTLLLPTACSTTSTLTILNIQTMKRAASGNAVVHSQRDNEQ